MKRIMFIMFIFFIETGCASDKEVARKIAADKCLVYQNYLDKSEKYFVQLNERLYRQVSDEVKKPGKDFLEAHKSLIKMLKDDENCR